MGAYNCRTIANSKVMSEHNYGTAIDVSKIDGATIKLDWNKENKKIFEYAFDNLKESINKTITSELNKNNEQISYTADVLGKKLEEVNKTLKLLNITIDKVEDSDKQKINQKIDKIEKVLSKINEKVHEKKGFW